jgi:hypothetical protein
MSNKLIIGLIVIVLFGVVGIGCLGTVFGFRTECVNAEAGITAQFKANESSYDNMWKTFKEMAQVPKMFEEHMKDVWNSALKGRYGEKGVSTVFLALKEENPKLDPTMYTKIQTAIEAGRTRFNQDQKELLDKKAQYERILNGNTALLANNFFHFPHMDLSKFDIVTSDVTEQAFTTKKADQIQLQ